MTKKIAVSLPDELVADAHRAVAAGHSASVSAYVAESLRERSGRESLAAVVRDLIADVGEPTAADRAVARRVLRGTAISQPRVASKTATRKPRAT